MCQDGRHRPVGEIIVRLSVPVTVAASLGFALFACSPAEAHTFRLPSGMYADTPTTYSSCGGTLQACDARVVRILNVDRAAHRLPPLRLSRIQSQGTSACVGSLGHSVAMARSGNIWHVNSHHALASFPKSICGPYHLAGENVGEASGSSLLDNVTLLDGMMMSEPHSAHTCKVTVNHACNILSQAYTHVGIGLYVDAAGTTWLTEDFTE